MNSQIQAFSCGRGSEVINVSGSCLVPFHDDSPQTELDIIVYSSLIGLSFILVVFSIVFCIRYSSKPVQCLKTVSTNYLTG